MSNAIKAENGIEVYEHDIKYYADEYISQLPEKEDSINNNPSLFTGMIKYIYKHLFKPGKKDKVKYNACLLYTSSRVRWRLRRTTGFEKLDDCDN